MTGLQENSPANHMSLSTNFWIFPDPVMGSMSTNTQTGIHQGAVARAVHSTMAAGTEPSVAGKLQGRDADTPHRIGRTRVERAGSCSGGAAPRATSRETGGLGDKVDLLNGDRCNTVIKHGFCTGSGFCDATGAASPLVVQ